MAKERRKRTAVVVIHGIGEQRPMETLNLFVEAAWVHDPELAGETPGEVFSKPDRICGSFELRRVTTRTSPTLKRRCDFFEFYWAHLMTGNKAAGLIGWLTALMVRFPWTVPRRLLAPWLVALGLFLLAAAAASMPLLPREWRPESMPGWLWPAAAAMAAALGLLLKRVLVPFAGDAARYLTPRPDNIAARQAIREAGVDLLSKLEASGKYDRIVLAGHSLGAAVGYDLLHHAWARIGPERLADAHRRGSAAEAALARLEAAAGALIEAEGAAIGRARTAYREAQRDYGRALAGRADGAPPVWLVSDFVTFGSPLSKADILLAPSLEAWERMKARREAPSAPPWLESRAPPRFSFAYEGDARVPHHAAVFAPTVWTNVWFDNPGILAGDLVAGPTAPLIGRGVLDVRVASGWPSFRHLDYWTRPAETPPRPWIRAMRRALNLAERGEAALWEGQAGAVAVRAEQLAP